MRPLARSESGQRHLALRGEEWLTATSLSDFFAPVIAHLSPAAIETSNSGETKDGIVSGQYLKDAATSLVASF